MQHHLTATVLVIAFLLAPGAALAQQPASAPPVIQTNTQAPLDPNDPIAKIREED